MIIYVIRFYDDGRKDSVDFSIVFIRTVKYVSALRISTHPTEESVSNYLFRIIESQYFQLIGNNWSETWLDDSCTWVLVCNWRRNFAIFCRMTRKNIFNSRKVLVRMLLRENIWWATEEDILERRSEVPFLWYVTRFLILLLVSLV